MTAPEIVIPDRRAWYRCSVYGGLIVAVTVVVNWAVLARVNMPPEADQLSDRVREALVLVKVQGATNAVPFNLLGICLATWAWKTLRSDSFPPAGHTLPFQTRRISGHHARWIAVGLLLSAACNLVKGGLGLWLAWWF